MGTVGNAAAAAAANTNTSGTTTSLTNLAGNFNTFIQLLTTQLQNQDPTNPTDTSQFTQQLVEFAGVQQQLQTNTLLQQLVTNSTANQVGSASSFVGTTIQAAGNQTALVGGTVPTGGTVATGGTAQIGYTLASAASQVNVTITDSNGNQVFSGTGTGTAGSNTVSWNGVNSFTGASEPDGVYNVAVTATNSNGGSVTATPFIEGTVSSASISNGSVMLNIGALQVPEANVTSITNLPGASSGSGSAQATLTSALESALNSIGL